ncbi:MAG: CusA/CzcA family heavy metal efflux RND transporter [Xanthomonadaceae bacterium]|nr:CusA/CzcA family heavy metal efflux RND transporter [Xanthomonadaceae bacterium]
MLIERIIRTSLAHRGVVLVAAVLLTLFGLFSLRTLPLDAIPDLSDTQVIVRTSWVGQTPQTIEDQVTYPIATRMLAVPGARAVRGFSMFGDSFVYIIFEDGTDLYWARSRVLEYLSQVGSELPAGVEPQLGPDATGVGWVFQYALIDRTVQHDLAELRSLQDWFLRFELQQVPGVAEVASVGGFVRQYEAIIDPLRLQAYGIGFDQLTAALRAANRESSGGVIEIAEAEYAVRGIGFIQSLEALGAVPTGVQVDGQPVLLRDVAEIRFGPAPRRGISEFGGEGEAVGGIIVMRDGGDAKAVIDAVKARLDSLRAGLPDGVEIVTVYDRSALISRAVGNLTSKLIEELIVVVLVCALFLWHFRSAMVVAITLPLGVLAALAIMRWQGLNANIMSLGGIAIAIGAMVDAAVVMIENAHKHLETWRHENNGAEVEGEARWKVIGEAAIEVAPALFFSLLIIALSFIPVFMLEAQEGRMFAPLAWTKTWAMVSAAVLSITLVPVLMGSWIRGHFVDESEQWLSRNLMRGYRPALALALRWPRAVLALSVALLLVSAWPWSRLGSEFMPQLEEGDLLYMPTTLPSLSPAEALALLQRTDRLIRTVPEVDTVFGKIGRADSATDPAPLTMIETVIRFKPESEWRPGLSADDLVAELDRTVKLPGVTNAWVPPILNRINMQVSGIRTPLGVRVTGPDLAGISREAERIAELLQGLPGTRSAFAERTASARYIEIEPDREALARFGLSMEQMQNLLANSIGGAPVSRAVEGRERYPMALRLPQSWRDSPEALALLPIHSPSGAQAALGTLARIEVVDGPPMIRSENARLAGYVFVDLEPGADLGGYIERAEAVFGEQLRLPSGYAIGWAGSYEFLQRAEARLWVAVPLTLVIVFALLYFAFGRIAEASIVMLSVPLSLVGGIWLLWALDYSFSVAVAVGFIALAGVAAEFGVVMLIYLDVAVRRARESGRLSLDTLDEVLTDGALKRIRPKAMTVFTIVAGLTTVMLAEGAGAATMQRIAAPMLGGMLSAPLLSLLVIPAIYRLWLARQLAQPRAAHPLKESTE